MSEPVKRSDWSYCPACGGGIDTGYECGKCGRDWLEFHQTRSELIDARATLEAECRWAMQVVAKRAKHDVTRKSAQAFLDRYKK
jgi:hypothetical protein